MQQQPQHNMAAGTFDMGGGRQLQLKINGKTPEDYLKDKASSMIWGWIIGAVIIGILVLGGVGLGGYIYFQAKNPSAGQRREDGRRGAVGRQVDVRVQGQRRRRAHGREGERQRHGDQGERQLPAHLVGVEHHGRRSASRRAATRRSR